MLRIERIKKILKENFKPLHLKLIDKSKEHIGHNNFSGNGQTHIYLEIKSEKFKGKQKIQIHREINSLIQHEYNNGLHSLEIKIVN